MGIATWTNKSTDEGRHEIRRVDGQGREYVAERAHINSDGFEWKREVFSPDFPHKMVKRTVWDKIGDKVVCISEKVF